MGEEDGPSDNDDQAEISDGDVSDEVEQVEMTDGLALPVDFELENAVPVAHPNRSEPPPALTPRLECLRDLLDSNCCSELGLPYRELVEHFWGRAHETVSSLDFRAPVTFRMKSAPPAPPRIATPK